MGEAWVNHRHVTWPSAGLLVSRGQAEPRVYGVEPIRIARRSDRPVVGGRGLEFHTASGRLDKVALWPRGKAGEQLAELGWH
ncbi:hypothetical protein OHS58_46290 [Amycolatopsis sp. NBC_00348]|uniref:hypothetical protein n=1 Tax=Amycolatopsis sp. NBC_00348 TaxID=2975956 RepID=UPI002E2764C7